MGATGIIGVGAVSFRCPYQRYDTLEKPNPCPQPWEMSSAPPLAAPGAGIPCNLFDIARKSFRSLLNAIELEVQIIPAVGPKQRAPGYMWPSLGYFGVSGDPIVDSKLIGLLE